MRTRADFDLELRYGFLPLSVLRRRFELRVGRAEVAFSLSPSLSRATKSHLRSSEESWGPGFYSSIRFQPDPPPGAARVRLGEIASHVAVDGERVAFSPLPHEAGRPDRIIHLHILPAISWTLARAGLFQIHAAGVVGSRGAILFVGRSGSGKSTLAGECRGRGATPLADDRALLWEENGRIYASSSHEAPTPFTLWSRLRPEAVIRGEAPLPRLAEDPPPGPHPVAAIVFPKVAAGEESEIRRLAPRDAAARLLSAYSFGDRPPEAVMDLVASAAARLPVFALRSGRSLASLTRLWEFVLP